MTLDVDNKFKTETFFRIVFKTFDVSNDGKITAEEVGNNISVSLFIYYHDRLAKCCQLWDGPRTRRQGRTWSTSMVAKLAKWTGPVQSSSVTSPPTL